MADQFDMCGVLFATETKSSDRAPDYTGKLTIHGTEWRLAGWLKTGKRGEYLSLKASQPASGPAGQRAPCRAPEPQPATKPTEPQPPQQDPLPF